jgi:hypothetical protein
VLPTVQPPVASPTRVTPGLPSTGQGGGGTPAGSLALGAAWLTAAALGLLGWRLRFLR